MDSDNDDRNESTTGLSSAEYRAKLLTKLNCLIAVLQVAIAKISRSMDLPGANEDRLLKIRSNLENTLSICKRAKGTLEDGVDHRSRKRSGGKRATGGDIDKMSYRDYVELSSIDEYQKFKTLPPIENSEVASVNIDELIERLSEDV